MNKVRFILLLIFILPVLSEQIAIQPNTWDMGSLLATERRFTTENSSIVVRNLSDTDDLYLGIRIKDTDQLKAGFRNGLDTFAIKAAFCKMGDKPAVFHDKNDAVVCESKNSPWVGRRSSRRFGPAGRIAPGESQILWLSFTAPMRLSHEVEAQTIVIEICARNRDEEIVGCQDLTIVSDIKPIPQAILDRMNK